MCCDRCQGGLQDGANQAGSFFLRCLDSFSGAKDTLCFCIDLSRLAMTEGIPLVWGPLVGGDHDVRKALRSFVDLIPEGWRQLMIALKTKVHVGREGERLR